jgi:transcriptional regulator with XRE-family HTH domain
MGRKVKRATPYAAEGNRLKAARLALGFKVMEHFAQAAGIRSNYYSSFETGARLITLTHARALKQRFGFGLDYIFDGDLYDVPQKLVAEVAANISKP